MLERRRRALLGPVVLLLLGAIASNVYLTGLYVEVHASGAPDQLSSFCKVSEKVDCVKVAASSYATLLGVPISIYALEFFALALLVVGLSALRLWRLRAWDSLVFVMLLLALPVSLLMAWLSLFRIESVCLLCAAVYGINILLLVLLAAAHRRRLRALLREGPRELGQQLRVGVVQLGALALVGIGLSQLLWLPRLLPTAHAQDAARAQAMDDHWASIPQQGLSLGAPDAKVTIEVFTDFECPFCAKLHDVLREVVQQNPGKVRLVHRDFPLDQSCNRVVTRRFHDNACAAALYARCAAEQGLFWRLSSYLFHHQRHLQPAELDNYARLAGLDLTRLQACTRRPEAKQAMLQDIEEGVRRKIAGTPAPFIGEKLLQGPQMIYPSFWQRWIDHFHRTGDERRPGAEADAQKGDTETADGK